MNTIEIPTPLSPFLDKAEQLTQFVRDIIVFDSQLLLSVVEPKDVLIFTAGAALASAGTYFFIKSDEKSSASERVTTSRRERQNLHKQIDIFLKANKEEGIAVLKDEDFEDSLTEQEYNNLENICLEKTEEINKKRAQLGISLIEI